MKNRFIEIQEKAIRDAERVDCSSEEFFAGLNEMLEILEERVHIEKGLHE